MDRDDFIISVYCLIEEQYTAITNGKRLRKRGIPPKLSDVEVITIEICSSGFMMPKPSSAIFGSNTATGFQPCETDQSLFVMQLISGRRKLVSNRGSFKSAARCMRRIRLSISLLCRYASIYAADKTDTSNLTPIMAIVRLGNINLVAQTRKNMALLDLPHAVRRQFRRWRKKIETVISQLAGRFQKVAHCVSLFKFDDQQIQK